MTDTDQTTDRRWVAIRHRAAGSRSVHFGPFTYAELVEWTRSIGFGVELVELVDPASDPERWWD